MIFALQNFRHYLLANLFTLFIDHQTLKYLVDKHVHQGKICRLLLLFQEFEFNIIVRHGKKNVRPNHLFQFKTGEDPTIIEEDLPYAHLFRVKEALKYLEEITNFLEEGKAPKDLSENKKKVLALNETLFEIINEYLYKMGHDDILRRCALENEREDIINEEHAEPVGATFRPTRQHKRYFRWVCGGQIYINIAGNRSRNVIVVK
jgi:hypothetical protein